MKSKSGIDCKLTSGQGSVHTRGPALICPQITDDKDRAQRREESVPSSCR